MKKSMRIALTVAVLASLAPIALAFSAPGGGNPQPQVSDLTSVSLAVAAVLSLLGL